MVGETIRKVMTLLMQMMWKVVSPKDLKLGDHIYTYGLYGLYSHHGIYVGDGYGIHFTRTENKETTYPYLSNASYEQQICLNFPECEYQNTIIKRGVVKTCLNCFRRDGKNLRSVHRYGYGSPRLEFELARRGTCTTLSYTKLPHQVVEKANELHAHNAFGKYSLVNNNCEHFATFCRTDIRKSEQTAFVGNCERRIQEAKGWTMRLLQRN